MLENTWQLIVGYVPNVIGAVLILVIGWLIAMALASLVSGLFRRFNLDQRLGQALTESGEQRVPRVTYWIGRLVFWLVMLVAIVGALQALNLTLLVAPFNELLNSFLTFLPRLVAAAIVGVTAWIVATVLRFLTARGLRAIHFDERMDAEQRAQAQAKAVEPVAADATATPSARTPLSTTLGTTVYWLVWFLFLPALLGALGLESLLLPVQQTLTELLLYLPNLLAAAAILILGWFAAGFVRRITLMAARGLGVDRLSDRVGLSRVLGQGNLSGLIGWVVYIMILIPVVVASLNALGIPAITAPASAMLAVFLGAIPAIFAAAVLLGVAFVVGRLVGRLVADLLQRLGFDGWMRRLYIWNPPATTATSSIEGSVGSSSARTPSEIVGWIVMVAVVLFASTAALNLLGLTTVAVMLADFTILAGRILLGLAIFALGLVVANVAARAILSSNITQSRLLALVARIAILVLATAMALRQMGLANEIVNLAFGLLFGAFAVAFALAFGLGGREPAQKEVERFFHALHTREIGADAPTVEKPRIESSTRPTEASED